MNTNATLIFQCILALSLWSCSVSEIRKNAQKAPNRAEFVGMWAGRNFNPNGGSRDIYMQSAWIIDRRGDGTYSITYYTLNNKRRVAIKESKSPLEGQWLLSDGIIEECIVGSALPAQTRKAVRMNKEIRFIPLAYRSPAVGGLGWSEKLHGAVEKHSVPMGDLQNAVVQYEVETLLEDGEYDFSEDYRLVTEREFSAILDSEE